MIYSQSVLLHPYLRKVRLTGLQSSGAKASLSGAKSSLSSLGDLFPVSPLSSLFTGSSRLITLPQSLFKSKGTASALEGAGGAGNNVVSSGGSTLQRVESSPILKKDPVLEVPTSRTQSVSNPAAQVKAPDSVPDPLLKSDSAPQVQTPRPLSASNTAAEVKAPASIPDPSSFSMSQLTDKSKAPASGYTWNSYLKQWTVPSNSAGTAKASDFGRLVNVS